MWVIPRLSDKLFSRAVDDVLITNTCEPGSPRLSSRPHPIKPQSDWTTPKPPGARKINRCAVLSPGPGNMGGNNCALAGATQTRTIVVKMSL